MKVQDTRDGRIFEGELVAILPANVPLLMEDVRRFYEARPGDKNYDVIVRPCSHARMVLDRGDGEDPHYYIIPRYDFYKEVKG